ncbi:DUF2066 domain-containing protein [Neptuniibacter sp. 1_MG-2023]|uniref:DUF2066 domain-containing protein n=1 Tax=Neptuniibacter sp. 1_MG-2023 TaxID=3062662 RepID=UPI0026E20ABA|nr:DUF2066 domain-containing protein [Neptuniibacter sp. 1_MG-2023]MDO6593998.1 DUF2066 domain-containing protein [Neptuniibacter sp. 1_MG-2023]
MDVLRTYCITLLVFVFAVVTPVAHAGTMSNLYSVELPVNAETQAPTDAQITEGLKQVLVKVSGKRSLNTHPVIRQQLQTPSTFLQQFSFTSRIIAGQNVTRLLLDYNSAAVDHLITQTGVKPLGIQRPTLLVWLVSDQQGYQDFVSADSVEINLLNSTARARGLPIQLPLLDLQDQTAIQVSDVWGLFEDAVQASSIRYRPDAVIAARLQKSNSGVIQLEAIFLTDGKVERLSYSGNAESVLTQMVDTISDQLFNPVVSHDLSYFQSGVAVKVSNINSLSNYVQMTDFLKSLPIVRTLKPERVMGGDVVLRLELDGSEKQLQQAIGVEPRIQAMDQQLDLNGFKILSYRWQG